MGREQKGRNKPQNICDSPMLCGLITTWAWILNKNYDQCSGPQFPIIAAQPTPHRLQHTHIHFTLCLYPKGIRSQRASTSPSTHSHSCHGYHMEREALAHFAECSGQRENFRHYPSETEMGRPPAERLGPAIHPLNVCVCGLRPQLRISISIDTQPRVSPLNCSLEQLKVFENRRFLIPAEKKKSLAVGVFVQPALSDTEDS